jgi:hypothetical protein
MSQTPPPTELPLALGQLVLPWAEVHRPEAFQATMAVMQAGTPQALLNYLIRLVEVRWAEDPAWRLDALHIATNSLNIHTLVILWDAHPAAYADLPDRVKLAIEAYQRAKR